MQRAVDQVTADSTRKWPQGVLFEINRSNIDACQAVVSSTTGSGAEPSVPTGDHTVNPSIRPSKVSSGVPSAISSGESSPSAPAASTPGGDSSVEQSDSATNVPSTLPTKSHGSSTHQTMIPASSKVTSTHKGLCTRLWYTLNEIDDSINSKTNGQTSPQASSQAAS